VERQQAVLPVDRAQNALALGDLETAERRTALGGLKAELLVARDDDGAGNGRQVARLPALLVVLHQLFDLLANDLALIRLFVRGNAALEQVPVDLGLRHLFFAAHARLSLVLIAQDLETNELVDVTGRQGGLIELHAELLHPDSGYADHKSPTKESDSIVCARARSMAFAQDPGRSGPVTASISLVSLCV
jgi:hypothetical protein